MELNYKKLQNGSDIRGIAMDGVEGEDKNLGREETQNLTAGFVLWLCEKTGKSSDKLCISVGRDSRLTGEILQGAALETLSKAGVKALNCGMASTPAMFMSTVFDEYSCDGAIMITASHLPFNRNGFKYFDCNGGLNKEDISKIIEFAQSPEEIKKNKSFNTNEEKMPLKVDLMDTYSSFLRKKIIHEVADPENREKPLKNLKIVVDAGNGAGGFYAKKILAPLGADISASQFLEPDGNFPNHQPNPENKEAMDSISRQVISSGADLGIIFDTDVDRSSAVDGNGKEISRNRIVAMAAALIARKHPGTTVVTDSITSDQLTYYLEQCLGLKHLRFKRGYKNVINKSIELNSKGIDSQLAIETSGHAAYKENYFLDDGAYLATKIVIKAAQLARQGVKIDVILSSLEEPVEAREWRFPISAEDFGQYGQKILDDLKTWALNKEKANHGVKLIEPNYEGVRIAFDCPDVQGWCLLRKSLHDPILPLNVEVTRGSCQTILEQIKEFLSDYDKVKI